MASIQSFLDKIKSAIYGEEVRGSIVSAIEAMNEESSSADRNTSTIVNKINASTASVTGTDEGTSPTVTIADRGEKFEFVFTIPKGDTGPQGPQGETGAQGPQGEPGASGVYVGSDAPTDPDVNVWIDPDGEASFKAVRAVNGVAADDEGDIRLTASDVGAASTEEVSNLKDDIAKQATDIANASSGIVSFMAVNFEHGTIMSNGELGVSGYKYRVRTPMILVAENDIEVSNVKDGFVIHVFVYGDDGQFERSYDGSTAPIRVESGTHYRIMIRKSSENTSEVADIEEFVNAFTWTIPYVASIESNSEEIVEIKKDMYFDSGGFVDVEGESITGYFTGNVGQKPTSNTDIYNKGLVFAAKSGDKLHLSNRVANGYGVRFVDKYGIIIAVDEQAASTTAFDIDIDAPIGTAMVYMHGLKSTEVSAKIFRNDSVKKVLVETVEDVSANADAIEELKNLVGETNDEGTYNALVPEIKQGYFIPSKQVGEKQNYQESDIYHKYFIYPVEAGRTYRLYTRIENGWYFVHYLDAEQTIVKKDAVNDTGAVAYFENYLTIAPVGAAYIVVNSLTVIPRIDVFNPYTIAYEIKMHASRNKAAFCFMQYNVGDWFEGAYRSEDKSGSIPADEELYRKMIALHSSIFERYSADFAILNENAKMMCLNRHDDSDAFMGQWYRYREEAPIQNQDLTTVYNSIHSNIRLFGVSTHYFTGEAVEPNFTRNFVKGYVYLNGKKVAIYCTHFSYKNDSEGVHSNSYNQTTQLLADMANEEYAIVAADWNHDKERQPDFVARFEDAGYEWVTAFTSRPASDGRVYGGGDAFVITPNIKVLSTIADEQKLDADFINIIDHVPQIAYFEIY